MVSHAGQLLVATPRLADPNFARTVIFVIDHDDDGALGVVINRPSELPLRSVLPSWAGVVAEPSLLFVGGPVATDSALAVGVPRGEGPDTGFRRLTGGYGLIDLDAEPSEVTAGLVGARVFSGYAGWTSDQLDAEIAEGSWYVVGTQHADLLDPDPSRLWRRILRRQPGELAYVATFPDDPSMN